MTCLAILLFLECLGAWALKNGVALKHETTSQEGGAPDMQLGKSKLKLQASPEVQENFRKGMTQALQSVNKTIKALESYKKTQDVKTKDILEFYLHCKDPKRPKQCITAAKKASTILKKILKGMQKKKKTIKNVALKYRGSNSTVYGYVYTFLGFPIGRIHLNFDDIKTSSPQVVAHMLIHESAHKYARLVDYAYATEAAGKTSEMKRLQDKIEGINALDVSLSEKTLLLKQVTDSKNFDHFRTKERPWAVAAYPTLSHKECMKNADSLAMIVTDWCRDGQCGDEQLVQMQR
jgi:hypothetical protein